MDYRDILVESTDQIGIITLNSPKTFNALSESLIGEITSALEDFASQRSAKVLIFKTSGKHFCSGHNLNEMIGRGMADYSIIFEKCTKMMKLIHEIPQVVIAQVHGVATAAGCQLVATCDMAVADETARFGTPGVRIGLFCSTPMIALSRAIGRKRAMEMLMTGRLVSAHEAESWGLVNKVVPEVELDKAVMDMANTVAEASPLVLEIGKKAFYGQIELDESRAYNYGTQVIALNLMAEDAQDGIKSFLAKTKPTWKGR